MCITCQPWFWGTWTILRWRWWKRNGIRKDLCTDFILRGPFEADLLFNVIAKWINLEYWKSQPIYLKSIFTSLLLIIYPKSYLFSSTQNVLVLYVKSVIIHQLHTFSRLLARSVSFSTHTSPQHKSVCVCCFTRVPINHPKLSRLVLMIEKQFCSTHTNNECLYE